MMADRVIVSGTFTDQQTLEKLITFLNAAKSLLPISLSEGAEQEEEETAP